MTAASTPNPATYREQIRQRRGFTAVLTNRLIGLLRTADPLSPSWQGDMRKLAGGYRSYLVDPLVNMTPPNELSGQHRAIAMSARRIMDALTALVDCCDVKDPAMFDSDVFVTRLQILTMARTELGAAMRAALAPAGDAVVTEAEDVVKSVGHVRGDAG